MIARNVQKVREVAFDLIAPSHGPIYDHPKGILSADEDWGSDRVSNLVVLPYISMHGSTGRMVNDLTAALAERGVSVQPFELSTTDIGKLAMALVDAATVVIGAPTVHGRPHPSVFSATHLANALRPKLKYAAIIGSYGWDTQSRGADRGTDPQPQSRTPRHGAVQRPAKRGNLRGARGTGRCDSGEARDAVTGIIEAVAFAAT